MVHLGFKSTWDESTTSLKQITMGESNQSQRLLTQLSMWHGKICFVGLIVLKPIQIADEQSIQLLCFSFKARTFAYRRLGHGSNSSHSAFNSYVREYFDRAEGYAQYVDDIGIAAHTADEFLQNNEFLFQRTELAVFKLSISDCTFVQIEIGFLAKTISEKV